MSTASSQPIPKHGSVHIWHGAVQPDVDEKDLPLSDDERKRAQAIVSAAARSMFLTTHAALRNVLARYLDRDPRDLQFAYGPHGKPYLALENMTETLHFNLSHSDRLFGIAIASEGELGFDIEWIDGRLCVSSLADKIMAPNERGDWLQTPAEDRRYRFFYYWTRKEALLKARGRGLTVDPRTVDVGADRVEGYSLRSGVPKLGYVDCLAAPWDILDVHRQWLWGSAAEL
jgi:4'-phosphopantetheinyl transferase